jgi:integrase/recombinase XerD
MPHLSKSAPVPSGPDDQLRLAAAACLARYTGISRDHTEPDLRCYLTWCTGRGLHPLAAGRLHPELYIRWMQEVRRFRPSTVSRRPAMPPESPTPGFTRLQSEALLTAARESPDDNDFALVAMLGLPGLRAFEAAGADTGDPGEEHGHRVLRVCGRGTKVVLVPLPPAAGRAIDRATDARASGPIPLSSRGTRMDRHAATRRLRRLAEHAGVKITRTHPHMLRRWSRPCPMRGWLRTARGATVTSGTVNLASDFLENRRARQRLGELRGGEAEG